MCNRIGISRFCWFYSLDGLLALCLSDLGLHVPLGQDLGERGSDDGALELLGAARSLTRLLLLDALLVLAPVQHGPRNLARVALHQVRALALLVQESERLQYKTTQTQQQR